MYPTLAIDYGMKHIGIAISDSRGIVASPLPVLNISKNTGHDEIIQSINEIVIKHGVGSLLVGIPQAFNEDQEINVRRIKNFIKKLEKVVNLPVHTIDESFSTREASDVILSAGQSIKKRKKDIDSIAAAVFLQSFLNSKN